MSKRHQGALGILTDMPLARDSGDAVTQARGLGVLDVT